jgi:hypothetical protein
MPIVPVRDLGKYGVIADVDPFNLPVGAWSMGVNARFYNGQVSRGPAFRQATALSAAPRFLKAFDNGTGTDTAFVGFLDGSISTVSATGTVDDVSIAGYVPASSEAIYTACELGGIFYCNRPDRAPWAFLPSATNFTVLAAWDAGWRTNLLRAYNGALVALNVTKSGTNYPTLVKTSDIVSDAGVSPSSWDNTLTTNNATENPLVGMKSAITDAAVLGGEMIIYGLNEAWVMVASGGTEVYDYRKLPFNKGAINANCSVEIGNKHYVFGSDDIWVHDGTSDQSIADGRVRNFIFSSLSPSKFTQCFVAHNSFLKEVSFCYVSGDAYVKREGIGCNRAAVYNYVNDTWTFDDLPLVFAADMSNANKTTAWSGTGSSTWDSFGGSWQDQGGGFKRVLMFVGESATPLTNALYAQDLWGTGSLSAYDVSVAASPTMTLERNWMDLDELGEELRGYKHILALYPEARLDAASAALEFRFGSADYATPSSLPLFSAWQTYDNNGNYKLDYTDGGRYLSLQCQYQDYKAMVLTGLDLDLVSTGSR